MVPTSTVNGHQTSLDSQSNADHPVFSHLSLLPEEVKTPAVVEGHLPGPVLPMPVPAAIPPKPAAPPNPCCLTQSCTLWLKVGIIAAYGASWNLLKLVGNFRLERFRVP